MRVIVQRSKNSYVKVDNKIVGKIDKGLVLLVGFTYGDDLFKITKMVQKIIQLRIFDDENGIMNKSIQDIQGQILSISQFTLYADTKKGNRPSYINALKSQEAKILYEEFNTQIKQYLPVQTGIFGADMQVTINNDGPVTISIEI